MKPVFNAGFLALILFLVPACTKVADPTSPVTGVSNVYVYYSYSDPAIRTSATAPTYPMLCALVDANTNILYQFSQLYTNYSEQQLVRPGTYYPAYRPWTNANGSWYPGPWRVTNAVSLSSSSFYLMTVLTFASNTNDFVVSPEKTAISVGLDPYYY